jgi:hypothetical protein
VDGKVLEFVLGNIFAPGDFTLNQQGVCRLNPHLSRHIVRLINIEAQAAETVQVLRRSL